MLLGHGDDTELRDLQLGQVVKLGDAAARIVQLLDGTRTSDELLIEASRVLGEEVNPLGLVELLQALDRRALLDTPRARMVASQGLVRADIASLNRLSRRGRNLKEFVPGDADEDLQIRMAPGASFSCHSCNRCCSERNVLGPIHKEERDAILDAFSAQGRRLDADPSHFIPLPGGGGSPVYLLRTQGGFCSYLETDGMCRIHRELGEEHKPAVCRAFPFRPVRTPTGWDVGMSLSCPTVAAGGGDPAADEAARTLIELGSRLPTARQVPLSVELHPGAKVAYARYAAWESAALDALSDTSCAPLEAWLGAIDSFQALADSADKSGDAAPEGDVDGVPPEGLGEPGETAEQSADHILRDLTLWSELLVGLEPTDPVAIRRFRSGAVRVRQRMAQHGDAPSVLAEHARRLRRAEFPQEDIAWLTADTLESSPLSDEVDGSSNTPVSGVDPEVQRRFLCQSLVEKRAFEYGSIGRGLLALTVFTAILGLDQLDGDELQPGVADIAYLVGHSQITDILDTRASMRAAETSAEVHRLLLSS
jgi:Fe-S-cluster containining protein